MLYVSIDNAYQFERAFPAERAKNYSYYGLKALFEYWQRYSEENGEDIEVSEELDYPCHEKEDAESALLSVDGDEHSELADQIEDPDELEEACFTALERLTAHVERLKNGNIFCVEKEG